jgi:hypothetical protein
MSADITSRVRGVPARRRTRRAALQDLGRSGFLAALGVSGVGHSRRADAEVAATATSAEADLVYLSATEARELFAAKQLSPVEVLEAQIAQIAARNAPTRTSMRRARAPGNLSGDTLAETPGRWKESRLASKTTSRLRARLLPTARCCSRITEPAKTRP